MRLCELCTSPVRSTNATLCNIHYQRVRRHGPSGEFIPKSTLTLRRVAGLLPTDECIGEADSAYYVRAVCAEYHGLPSDGMECCHRCPDGEHSWCLNPGHMRWDTRSGNERDKIRNGTGPTQKLSVDDVRRIRLLLTDHTRASIAHEYGVCRSTINHIAAGITWSWLE